MSAAVNDAGDDEEEVRVQDEHPRQWADDGVDRPDVESYDTEEGIVFYDPDNPLAWIEVKGEAGHAYVEVRNA